MSTKLPAELFREMADRIEKNDASEFAGAILIVPPSGEPIQVMINDPTQDIEAFWSLAMSRIAIAQAENDPRRTSSAAFRR